MSWEYQQKRAERGPRGFFLSAVVIIVLLGGLGVVASILARGCSVGNEAAAVAQRELGASALLKKYEWFKNASAQLDKKRADIQVYESKIRAMESKAKDRWAQDRLFQWETELVGVKASYNSLAAEYNAQMAKINWSFTNIGSLPAGATEVLPRQFKPYTTE